MDRYKIGATQKGLSVEFTVQARNGRKAVVEARRIAKAQGTGRILVNYVRRLDKVTYEYAPFYDAPLATMGGPCHELDLATVFAGMVQPSTVPVLSVNELNAKIERVWDHLVCFVPRPDRSPLKAYGLDGRIFLDDGVSGRQELYQRSSCELAILLYDWLTYVGYYCDDFEQFTKELWA